MASWYSMWTQFFPPKPQFGERDLPDLSNRVYIVTGANTGLGKELSRVLYSKNAKVYLTARTRAKAEAAIADIQAAEPNSSGTLAFLQLNLEDLTTIEASAEKFLQCESRLHGLFLNAAYMGPGGDIERTKQGYEMHLGVNCLGTFLFNKILTPVLLATTKDPETPPNSVRVIFMSSFAAEAFAEKDVGIDMNNLDYHDKKSIHYRYGISKVGNWAYAVEFSKRYKNDGVIGVPLSPGILQSELFRRQSYLYRLLISPFFYPIINGVRAQLWAGFSPEITVESAGSYVVAFGRFLPIRADLKAATKSKAEGGNGTAQLFWDWSDEQVKKFL
ncbi:putative estradiol 17 beta-dehydrogenase [Hypomontagnella monticulosa]|nr:putative estradiol 17 beta-dehydrogenase [Hypomontagnella monticulosa]